MTNKDATKLIGVVVSVMILYMQLDYKIKHYLLALRLICRVHVRNMDPNSSLLQII